MQPQTPLLFHGFSLVWTLLIALFKNGIFHDIKLSGFIKSIEFCSVQLHVHLQMEIYECYSFYLIFFDTSITFLFHFFAFSWVYLCMHGELCILCLKFSIIFQYHIHPSTLVSFRQDFCTIFYVVFWLSFERTERSLLLLLFEERTSSTVETTPGIGWIGEI